MRELRSLLDVEREFKRSDLTLGRLEREDRLLRERMNALQAELTRFQSMAAHKHLHSDLLGLDLDDHGAVYPGISQVETVTGQWTLGAGGLISAGGVAGEIVPQTASGVPSHTATEGTLYWDTGGDDLYVNSDGSTSWQLISGAGGGPISDHVHSAVAGQGGATISATTFDGNATVDAIWTHSTRLELDDGTGDSPILRFIGEQNDAIDIWLNDTGVPGTSHLDLRLADASGNSNFRIKDSSNFNAFRIDSDGNLWLRASVTINGTPISATGVWTFSGTGTRATFGDGTAGADITIDGLQGNDRQVVFESAGRVRWAMRANSSAEGGAAAGSDFEIRAYDDTPTYSHTALYLDRSDRIASFFTTSPGLTLAVATDILTIGGGSTLNDRGALELIGNRTSNGTISHISFHNTAATTANYDRVVQIHGYRDGDNDAGAFYVYTSTAAGTLTAAVLVDSSQSLTVTGDVAVLGNNLWMEALGSGIQMSSDIANTTMNFLDGVSTALRTLHGSVGIDSNYATARSALNTMGGNSLWVGDNLAVGATAATTKFNVEDSALNVASSYLGVRVFVTKTLGATTASHTLYGLTSFSEFNQSGGTLGNFYPLYIRGRLTDGTVSSNLVGSYSYLDLDAGTVNSLAAAVYGLAQTTSALPTVASLYGGYFYVDINSTSGNIVTGSVYGARVRVEKASGSTVTGNLYGLYVSTNAGLTVFGTEYALYIANTANDPDYAIYSASPSDSVLSGNLFIAGVGKRVWFDGTPGGGNEGITYDDSGSTERFGLMFPGSDLVLLTNRAASGTVQIRANNGIAGSGGEDTVMTFANHLTMGPYAGVGNVNSSVKFYSYNSAVDTTGSYYGIYSYHVKTLGATSSSDIMYGTRSYMHINQGGGTVGDVYGVHSTALISQGTVASSRYITSGYFLTDLDGGSAYAATGLDVVVDQESGNSITYDIYGLRIRMYLGGTVGNDAYTVYITDGSGTPTYSMYCNSAAPSFFSGGGGLLIQSTALDANHAFQIANNSAYQAKAYAWNTYTSSIKQKRDVRPVENSLELINRLTGITFAHARGDEMDGEPGLGITVEDLDSLGLPGLVMKDKEGECVGMNLTNLIPVLVQAVKELKAEVNSLGER